jgi:hypothetical protein
MHKSDQKAFHVHFGNDIEAFHKQRNVRKFNERNGGIPGHNATENQVHCTMLVEKACNDTCSFWK